MWARLLNSHMPPKRSKKERDKRVQGTVRSCCWTEFRMSRSGVEGLFGAMSPGSRKNVKCLRALGGQKKSLVRRGWAGSLQTQGAVR